MSTSFTIADALEYNSYHKLPYQERLEYLKNNWNATIEPEIFDSYRGIGRWVRYPDGSGWFEMRIPFDMLDGITHERNQYGEPVYREQDCRDLIAREGL
nr:MAG TPA: hypothetical protein [Caudoviricetes sp.]